MADTVRVRLEGGPCDGRNTTARVGSFGPVGVTCRGVDYQPTARQTASGRLIYTTKQSQQAAPPPSTSREGKANKAHGAWHHLLVSAFVEAPRELRKSAKAREALHRLRHRRGLR